MQIEGMNLKVLLPARVFLQKAGVTRIVAENGIGSFGLLPSRLDCVAALTPSILTFATREDGEVFVAVDAGVLVKTGGDVQVSVRRAVLGKDLAKLREVVEQEFLTQDDRARDLRLLMTKLETGFVARLANLHHG